MTRKAAHILETTLLVVVLLLIPLTHSREPKTPPPTTPLRCVVSASPAALHRSLVQKFAQDQALQIDILSAPASADSLLEGRIDLWITQLPDSLPEGLAASRKYASGTVWVVRSEEVQAQRRINGWLADVSSTRQFARLEKQYNRGKTVAWDSVSDYDGIIRRQAAEVGLDWRLVAAIIYHESRFHIEANSQKGAVGLMQIRSARYTDEEMLDPETNLRTGTRYLVRLLGLFSADAADSREALKFTLAAYNMGEGRLWQWMEQARKKGLDTTHWDTVSSLMPEGHHTRAYVNNVLHTYADYRKLYPL